MDSHEQGTVHYRRSSETATTMQFFCRFTSILLLGSTASSAVLDGATHSRYDNLLRKRMKGGKASFTYVEPEPYRGEPFVEDEDFPSPKQHQLETSQSFYEKIAGESPQVTSAYPILSERPAPNKAGQYEDSFIICMPGQKDVYVFICQDLPNVGNAWLQGKGMELLQKFQKSQSDSGSGYAGKAKAIASKLFKSKSGQVPTAEKIKYAILISIAKAEAQRLKGKVSISAGQEDWQEFAVDDIPIRRRDSQRNRFEARSPDTDTFVKPALLRDTAVSNGSSHASLAQVATLLDVSTPATVQKRAPPDSVIQSISKDTSGESLQSNSSTVDASSKFEAVIALYEAVQANISATIFPILTEMTSKTNSSLIFQAAQSIWIDLVSPSEIAVGPFQQGLNSLDQLVDSQAKTLNITVSDPAFQPYLEVGTILFDIYQDAWNRSYTAINQNGLLTKFNTLTAYLSVSTNSTVAPPSFFQVQNNTYDDAFFTDYTRNNKNLDQFLQ